MRLVLTLCLLAALPATAAPLAETRLAPGADCYRRLYDADHLAAHPAQMTQEIALSPLRNPAPDTDGSRVLLLSLRFRGDAGAAVIAATCAGSEILTCGIEGDAGQIRLMAAGGGKLHLALLTAVSVEGPESYLVLEPDGDDAEFLLAPSADCVPQP